jgi:hypothetical protein
LFAISSFLIAQSAESGREEKLQQLKSRSDIKVTESAAGGENNILKLEYPNGKVLCKNISDYKHPESGIQKPTYSPTYDSTIIDLRTIDTTLYYQKYHFWLEAPIGSIYEPMIGDINNNGLPEIYGRQYNIDTSYITVSEMDSNGNFNNVFYNDSAQIIKSIFDIDKDGGKELQLGSNGILEQYPGNSYLFYKKESDSSLATQLSFIFYSNGGQQEHNYFGDWDGDDYTDWIFVNLYGVPTNSINIYEFNPINNYFDLVYFYDISNHSQGGFSIGDFDQDGKTEFLGGNINGDVVSIENNGNNSYSVNWNGSVATWNAYLATQTNDLDKNGKGEIWILGQAFYNGIPKTRITLFEATGNDSYQAVGRIDLIGVFSFDAGNIQSLDVDKDGKDEVMICIDANVIILKFAGSTNDQKYEVYYIKQNSISGIYYFGAAMYDIDNDGKEEIIISTQNYPNTGHRLFSDIYKADSTSNVIKEITESPESFFLYQNYPNPFNPVTTIKFSISEHSSVSIKVYNVLGKEITTLLEKELSPGIYSINWEASDSSGKLLPSGVYLIRMTAEMYTKTIKALLLK